MGGGGFMHDANRVIAQNKALLNNSRFKIDSSRYSNEIKSDFIDKVEYTDDSKKKIKQILLNQRKESKIRFVKIMFASIIGGCLLAYILWSWMQI